MNKDFGRTPEERRKIWDDKIGPALDEVVLLREEMEVGKLIGLAEDKTGFHYIYGIMHTGVVMSPCAGPGYIRINEIEDYDREVRVFDMNFSYSEETIRSNADYNVFLREEELK